jgi:hypothetical protein
MPDGFGCAPASVARLSNGVFVKLLPFFAKICIWRYSCIRYHPKKLVQAYFAKAVTH